MTSINRREAIKQTAILMGGVISSSAIMGVLQGCTPQPGIDWKPEFLTDDQACIVSAIAEIYIPETDTAGAKKAGVPAFIEQMIFKVYSQEDRERFTSGMDKFIKDTKTSAGMDFRNLSTERQVDRVREVHDAEVMDEKNTKENYKRPFITMMKELTLLGFFTSKPGATEVLNYNPVPGHYFGCEPLEEVGGKTWAS